VSLLLALLALLGFTPSDPRQLPDPVTPPAPLVLRVDLPDLVPAGMNIPFTLALANTGDRAVPVELGGRPIAFDFIVRQVDGRLVWRRLEGVPVEAILIERTLAPGEVMTFQGHWNQRDAAGHHVPPGVYRVRGVLPVPAAAGGWGSPAREVTITP
jgi:hypothetical protein